MESETNRGANILHFGGVGALQIQKKVDGTMRPQFY
jgi:hypothetical protein